MRCCPGLPGPARLPQASNKEVLAAYARFYTLLLAAGCDSWHDYVLDQVGARGGM